jgi:hypothetical protein
MDQASASMLSPRNDSTLQCEIDRCRSEIQSIEAALLAGHPDVAGLCLALSDWSTELRILQNEERRQANPAACGEGEYNAS